MTRTWTIAAFCLALCPVLGARPDRQPTTGSPRARAERAVAGLSEAWARASKAHDASFLERIWAEDFLYVEASGRVFNKQEGIADEAASTDQVASSEIAHLRIRIYGHTTAVVIGDERETGLDKEGKPYDRRSRFTNIWVLRKGAWQCVGGHSSELPPK